MDPLIGYFREDAEESKAMPKTQPEQWKASSDGPPWTGTHASADRRAKEMQKDGFSRVRVEKYEPVTTLARGMRVLIAVRATVALQTLLIKQLFRMSARKYQLSHRTDFTSRFRLLAVVCLALVAPMRALAADGVTEWTVLAQAYGGGSNSAKWQ